jgi:hypothetical protein
VNRREAESRRALAEVETKGAHVWAYQIAEVHAWRGELKGALAWLERADEQWDGGLMEVKHSSLLRPLRGDPRFAGLPAQAEPARGVDGGPPPDPRWKALLRKGQLPVE